MGKLCCVFCICIVLYLYGVFLCISVFSMSSGEERALSEDKCCCVFCICIVLYFYGVFCVFLCPVKTGKEEEQR